MRLLDRIEPEDIFFLLIFMGVIAVLAILAVGEVLQEDGPATHSVEACAEIDDTERSVACFEAIGADR